MNPMLPLQGKTALITGASRGIGAAIAHAYAAAGASVVVNYVASAAKAAAVVQAIKATGAQAIALQADVADITRHNQLLDAAESALGPVAILVNNAGMETRKAVLDYSPDDWEQHFSINLKGAFFLAQATARRMISNNIEGRIINVSSTHEKRPLPRNALYNMTKAGMGMMTKSLALELAPHGIRVNGIIPGAIRTGINSDVLANPQHEAMVKARIPLGWIATPQDCAGAALLLAGEGAHYMTGSSITIDGGLQL